MNRPYIICHMLTSVDGKVTGDFLYRQECEKATDIYYEINRRYNKKGTKGFICGRVTMEGSFTKGRHPDLSKYSPVSHELELETDYIPDKASMSGFYAVAFDPAGKLFWENNRISDEDPGYNNAQIIEVLTRKADGRYLGYLREMKIPYIFAGETEIDVETALSKLKNLVGIDTILLEGGSIVNGYFQRAGVIDELSLVVAPVIADAEDKPLFADSSVSAFKLSKMKEYNGGVIWLNYKNQKDN